MSEARTYDYIIVGGGSAGCVLADRLTADGAAQVCLIEAGPADSSPLIAMPGGVIALMRSKLYNWQFWTAPQSHLDGRARYCPRGKTLGGSSSINAMVYIRGNAADYDQWAGLGNAGWSYRDVLPYFRSTENHERGADAYHGVGGPLSVTLPAEKSVLSRAFVAAAQEAGYSHNDDFNGAAQDGVGMYEVMQKGGERCSNARAFLRQAEARPNLTVLTDKAATRILFEGKQAAGVRYHDDGRLCDVIARREVIVCAGTIGSPHLLKLSGIGPREELERFGIPVVADSPGVGENLQDHLDILVSVRDKTRLAMSFHPLSLLRTIWEMLKYVFAKTGQFTSNVAEAGGFIRSRPEEPIPDLQLHFVPIANAYHALELGRLFKYAYTVMVCDLRPLSRGSVTLASDDPLVAPKIDPRYGAEPRDIDKLVIGIGKAREILKQKAFDLHRGEELEPGAALQSDEQLREWVRTHAETVYHPIGTCKMGVDAMAVVDPQLRVRGVTGLRVCDASIMPTLVGGNTNAPTTMIGEKAAAMIRQDAMREPQYAAAA
jgi:choline dehydrogenase-like flavoprotein